MTITEFELLPDARNRELVDGELVDVSDVTGDHHCLRDALLEVLGPYVRQHGFGRIICGQAFDFEGNAHGPDGSLSGPSKAALFGGKLRVQRFIPDLTIEIASQSDGFDVLLTKALRYRRCGTSEAWVFSIPNRMALVYSARGNAILFEDQNFESPLIPGFSIRLSELFAMI